MDGKVVRTKVLSHFDEVTVIAETYKRSKHECNVAYGKGMIYALELLEKAGVKL